MCLPVLVPGVLSTFPRTLQIACMTGAKRGRGGAGRKTLTNQLLNLNGPFAANPRVKKKPCWRWANNAVGP